MRKMLYLCGMKVLDVLKEFNCGLNSLNNEIHKLGLTIDFSINTRISEEDYNYLAKLLAEIRKEEELKRELFILREGISNLFLRDGCDPNLMGELQKRQYYNHILSKEEESVLIPNLGEYSEKNFWAIYYWYIEWNKKSVYEKKLDIDEFIKQNDDFSNLREIQKRGLVKFIDFVEGGNLTRPWKNDFDTIIKWYKNWVTKTEEEQEIEEEDTEIELIDKIQRKSNKANYTGSQGVDEESAIMAALAHGEGDRFGFD